MKIAINCHSKAISIRRDYKIKQNIYKFNFLLKMGYNELDMNFVLNAMTWDLRKNMTSYLPGNVILHHRICCFFLKGKKDNSHDRL